MQRSAVSPTDQKSVGVGNAGGWGLSCRSTMDDFDLRDGPALLARTPATLDAWMRDLPAGWLHSDEGPETWNPLVVLGHLIEGERFDWIPRVRHVLEFGETGGVAPFDRFAKLGQRSRSGAELL